MSKTGIVNFHGIEGDAADPSVVVREVGEGTGLCSHRHRISGHWRERAHRVQRSTSGLHDRRSVPHRESRRACRRQQVGEGWFADHFAGADARHLDVAAPDSQGQRIAGRCAGPAQGVSSESVSGGRDQSHGAGVDSAHASERDGLSRQGLGVAAESGAAESAGARFTSRR